MVSGDDPYLTYNLLTPDFRPIGKPEESPRPPVWPSRVRAFKYACAKFYEEMERRKAEAAAASGGLGG